MNVKEGVHAKLLANGMSVNVNGTYYVCVCEKACLRKELMLNCWLTIWLVNVNSIYYVHVCEKAR